jgi:RNA polymerase sigma-70 factor (ECF subfamily)
MSMSQPTIPPPQAPTTAELVRRIRSGDPDALSAAYYQFAGPLLTLAHRLLGTGTDAQDVVQDLFVALPEALEGYEERGRFPAWLGRALVRLALMRLRGRRRRQETDLRPTISTPARAGAAGIEDWDLEGALERLPEDQRAIVVLKAIEGYSHEEIAELLGIRRNTSAVRFHRALQRLRTDLEGQ